MSFLDISRRYLKRLDTPFEIISHKAVESTFEVPSVAGIPARQLVKTVLLADERGAVLVSLAADQGLDFEALNAQLKRRLSLAYAKQFHDRLLGFAPIMLPPWHRLYDLPWVVEHSLCEQPTLYVASGSPKAVIRFERNAFLQLSSDAQICHFGRQPRNVVQEARQTTELPEHSDAAAETVVHASARTPSLRERLAQGVKLPVMPGLTGDLVALKTDSGRDVLRASTLIEQDPVLSANLLRYAASPFFAYQGGLRSVQEAIHHVLGLDQALDLSIGLSLCSHFQGPREGRLGLSSLWRDAFTSASVCQFLASLSTRASLYDAGGTAFLVGLLHNIGYLAVAQMFPAEYALFNRLASQQTQSDVVSLEQRTLGVSHDEVGATLLASWGLDELLVQSAGQHHQRNYSGKHAELVHLVMIADQLMAQQGMGDAPPLEISSSSLVHCALDLEALALARSHMVVQQSNVEQMVSRVLAA